MHDYNALPRPHLVCQDEVLDLTVRFDGDLADMFAEVGEAVR